MTVARRAGVGAARRGGFRGLGAAVAWTPIALGSKLKLWLDERGQANSPIDGWTNQASGVNSFTAAGAGRPAVGAINGLAAPDFDPTDDVMTSTSALSALVSAAAYSYTAVVSLDGVTGVSGNAYQNNTIIADSGGFWGLHLKDAGSGNVTFQAYHWDGAQQVAEVTVAVATSPLTARVWYDGTTISLSVNGSAAGTDTAGSITTLTGTLRLGTGQTLRLNGRIGMIAVCNEAGTAAERASMATYTLRWGTPLAGYAAAAANLWGNGWTASSPTFWSSSAMMVAETDSPTLGVRYRSAGSGIDSEYGAMAVIRGASGARYGTTEVSKITAQSVAGSYDTGLITLGGSGSRRIFVVGGCLSGFIGQHIESIYVPEAYAATTSIVTRDATTSVAIDGWGSCKATEASDGFVVSGGVLSGDAGDVTKRAAYRTRIAAYGADEAFVCLGTNDGASGVSAADYQVALEARIDEIIGAGIAAGSITVCSPIKRGPNLAGEPAWMAGYRTAASAAATAKSTGYVDGGTLPASYSSLGPDQVHTDPGSPQQEIADAIASARGTTGKILLVGDSELCGSTDPTDWNTARGVVALVRIGRI